MPYDEWLRSKPGVVEYWIHNRVYNEDGPHVQALRTASQESGSRSSVRTPGYRIMMKAKKKISLPVNAYTYTKRIENYVSDGISDYEQGDAAGVNPATNFTSCTRGCINHGVNNFDVIRPDGGEINAVRNRAINNVLLEVKDQKVNVAQAAAERGQTTKLFASTARRVVDTVVLLKRGNWNKAAKGLGLAGSARKHRKLIRDLDKDPVKALGQAVLEIQYGWRPLLQDLYGSAEQIAQQDLHEIRSRVSKGASASGSVPYSWSTDLEQGVLSRNWKYSEKYVLYFATPSVDLHTLTQLGITNPATVLWELTPWSFVVDWFLPIGNWINSWDATTGLVFEKGSKTTAFEFNTVNTASGKSWQSGDAWGTYVNHTLRATANGKYVEIVRTSLPGWPSSSIPYLKNPVSNTHVLNAMALLITTFKR